jgi:hypothetical protein
VRILLPILDNDSFTFRDTKTEHLIDISEVIDTDYIYFSDVIHLDWYRKLTQTVQHVNILSDVESSFLAYPNSEIIFIPALTMGMNTFIKDFNSNNVSFPTDVNTTQCFTFFVNRKRYDRHIFLKLIEWFKFKNFSYLWHGKTREYDMEYFVNVEKDSIQNISNWSELQSFMLSPITLKKNFIDNSLVKSNSFAVDNWVDAHSKLNPNAAVHLVLESSTDNPSYNNYTFSEKTLYGILGLNFQIWPGNYGQAQKAKEMGIDIFDDIIDHSYQYEKTVFERCYYALTRNLEILTDLALAKKLRTDNIDRLIDNRTYCLCGGFADWVQQELNASRLSNIINIKGEYVHV